MTVRIGKHKRLAALLAKELPGTAVNGQVVMCLPLVSYMVRGLVVDRTSSTDVFKIWWIAMPLCRPWKTLVLSYGDTVLFPESGHAVRLSSPESRPEQVRELAVHLRDALNQARSISTPQEWCTRWPITWNCRHVSDLTPATMLALAGREGEAREAFRKLSVLPRDPDPAIEGAFAAGRTFSSEALAALDAGRDAFRSLVARVERDNCARLFPGLEPVIAG
jgi:hypothetical protein